jgi:hypothetical protein
MSNFHFNLSLKLSQGEVYDFSCEVQKFSGKMQKISGEVRTSPQNPANVEYLNIRLSFSFEHTDNISTQLVLMKAYFKLKKAIVF